MKLLIAGATGLVGRMMLEVLEERRLKPAELILAASSRSAGKKLYAFGREYTLTGMDEALNRRPDIALFSAGKNTALTWAPRFAEKGSWVIDNSSAWRMHAEHKLIVPEINAHLLSPADRIIANPNCSTIQMVLALAPLHQRYGIKRIVVSTYQAVSGSGMQAVRQLRAERKGKAAHLFYPHPIDLNCFPHGGEFLDNGYTTEEEKLLNETRKILDNQHIALSATVARIPVMRGHSESVNAEFFKDFDLDEVKTLLSRAKGVVLMDNPEQNEYPTPLAAAGKNAVFAGRIRRDFSHPNTLNLWIVSDNLRKGAATNAVQIAEHILKMGFCS